VDLAAYRIVQEAVTNVLRHAHARRVDCAVAHRDGVLELRVTDDGDGGVPGTGGGHGLVGMRERAALYGGTVEAGPAAGGFSVHAVLPVPHEQPARTTEDAR
jgi:signal transduction histidine kinase